MKSGNIDWSIMRGAVILFVLALVTSAGVIGGAVYFSGQMAKGYLSEKGRLSSIRSQYQTIDEQKQLIETYLPQYRGLENGGIVGEELRLNWLESMRAAAERVKLPALRYEIARRKPHAAAIPFAAGGFRLFESRMKLELGLLHEEDLPRLLNELDRRASGLYSLEECSLRRAGDAFIRAPDAQNLRAQCKLRWVTLRKESPPV